MEPFAPQSWEMPPGARVLEESASVVAREFDGERLNWKVALVQTPHHEHPILWIRPLDARFDSGFVELSNLPSVPFVVSRRDVVEYPLNFITFSFQRESLGRILFFNGQGDLCEPSETPQGAIAISPHGTASWCEPFAEAWRAYNVFPFRWSEPLTNAEFIRTNASDIWKRIQGLLASPDSEASFAHQFSLMKESERHALVLKNGSISKREFELALREIVIAQNLWDEERYHGEIRLAMYLEGDAHLSFGDEDEELSFSNELGLVMQVLRRKFVPINGSVANFLCVENWLEYHGVIVSLEISYPTAHEQLEAALRWRQWKENHEKF